MSLATQVKLLRVLDTSTFRHVGGTHEIRVDVRVIAATNRDLAGMVRQGLFREDLYYRLSTISAHLPPLRERGADVALLARHFVDVFNARFGVERRLSDEALAVLRAHPWPGNVRELLHVVEAAMVVCEGAVIRPDHLPVAVRTGPGGDTPRASGDCRTRRRALTRARHLDARGRRARARRTGAARARRTSRPRGEGPRHQRAQPVPQAARVGSDLSLTPGDGARRGREERSFDGKGTATSGH